MAKLSFNISTLILCSFSNLKISPLYFAKLHHGSISVKSEVGVGSEFVVKIANTLADENEIKIHYKMTKEERLQNIAVAFSDL